MPGPLPKNQRRRRNPPTIPTTTLPASGRSGPPPELPEWVELGAAGLGWWTWAWSTPQASAWSAGNVPTVARRASLEDDVAALTDVKGLDFGDVLDKDTAQQVRATVSRVASLATGKLNLAREMRELEDRLGLTPKGMASLRWQIVADVSPDTVDAKVTAIADYRAMVDG